VVVTVPDGYDSGAIDAVVQAHDPSVQFDWEVAQQRQEQAESDAATIPGWASWTEGEALAWMDANLKALLDAVPNVDGLTADQYRNNAQSIDAQWQDVFAAQQQVIRALVRLVIALRNDTWPRLEGS
jgi:hypothetical protein